MTTQKAILVCENPRREWWQLDTIISGRFVRLGWQQSLEDAMDGGVPDDVASLLARSMTSVALVTFPRSPESGAVIPVTFKSEDHVRTLRPTAWGDRLRAALSHSPLAVSSRLPSSVLLVSTRRPDVAKTLFHDGGFPWSTQGQVVLLSAPDVPPRAIDWRTLIALNDRPVGPDALASLRVDAIVRPGVDGDVAGIMSASDSFERQLLGSIEREAGQSGFSWRVLSEDAFAEELSKSRHHEHRTR